ncbi:BlaI/MecI/CopY family transcriptional regulator [Kitasatospora viridis]|uniref:Putative transcriptional regulator n=1 Tax=Kitasatospora viridis TaxID=281105 RepID=A0A561ULE6_9ACTN|nr:BlaI/MecI/CopY family transcriptional regulator [Kitasatospora viridis]TWG00191.1 putative transcriptional regulator [Kitasatospora viridis]
MQGLGQLEAEIMERLWDRERPTTVREVVDDLNRTRPVAYTTVNTVADILHRKGLLRRHKEGRAWFYQPVRTRAEHTAALMREVLGEAPDPRAALLHFVDAITPAEAAALRAALGEHSEAEGGAR